MTPNVDFLRIIAGLLILGVITDNRRSIESRAGYLVSVSVVLVALGVM